MHRTWIHSFLFDLTLIRLQIYKGPLSIMNSEEAYDFLLANYFILKSSAVSLIAYFSLMDHALKFSLQTEGFFNYWTNKIDTDWF